MALFGKKLTPLEEIQKIYEKLSDEEKEAVKKALAGEETETETETEKETVTPGTESEEQTETETETKTEEVATEEPETETVPEEEPEATPEENNGTETEGETAPEVPEVPETVSEEQADNRDEVIKGLTDRIIALEESLKSFDELKQTMEEYNAKNAEKFGYRGKSDTEKKSFQDMSTDELKERQKMAI